MARLYLITHAHTQQDLSVDARLWHLSDAGSAQAEQLAYLSFWAEVGRIVVSSEVKTALTVAPAAQRWHVPIDSDARFDELRRPGWISDRSYTDRVRAVFAHPELPAGDWESAQSALDRVQAGFNGLMTVALPPPRASLALVSHGLALSLLRAVLLGQSHVVFADWQQLGFAAIAIVDLETGRLEQDFAAVGNAPIRGA